MEQTVVTEAEDERIGNYELIAKFLCVKIYIGQPPNAPKKERAKDNIFLHIIMLSCSKH